MCRLALLDSDSNVIGMLGCITLISILLTGNPAKQRRMQQPFPLPIPKMLPYSLSAFFPRYLGRSGHQICQYRPAGKRVVPMDRLSPANRIPLPAARKQRVCGTINRNQCRFTRSRASFWVNGNLKVESQIRLAAWRLPHQDFRCSYGWMRIAYPVFAQALPLIDWVHNNIAEPVYASGLNAQKYPRTGKNCREKQNTDCYGADIRACMVHALSAGPSRNCTTAPLIRAFCFSQRTDCREQRVCIRFVAKDRLL